MQSGYHHSESNGYIVPRLIAMPCASASSPWIVCLGERLGSGDGERKTLLTRQIAFEPLPASVLFAFVWPMVSSIVML